MKTCNNCGTQNHLSVDRCSTCQMKQNFSYQDLPGESGTLNHHSIDCINCGQENPEESLKCFSCHFPIEKKEKTLQVKDSELEDPSFLEMNNKR